MSQTNGYPHLEIQRENNITEKRMRSGFTPPSEPNDPTRHAENLKANLAKAIKRTEENITGFDERRLLRFKVDKGFAPDKLQKISKEIEFVSQEADEFIVAFVSQAALNTFEARLASMSQGESVTYPEVVYAIQAFDAWTAQNRTGWALQQDGFPNAEPFMLDIELWPLESTPKPPNDIDKLCVSFEEWLKQEKIQTLDSVKQLGLILYRVKSTRIQADLLLQHRDVRTVDLPPRYGLNLSFLGTDIQDLPPISAPSNNAPAIAILDSGIISGHPLLAPAIGDAQSFISGLDETDGNGHGTSVAGIALYRDIAERIKKREFSPFLRIFSGRIFDANNEANTQFIENQVTEAVEYFYNTYDCKVFNLSYGDQNKPYLGRHVRGLAYILDGLARKLKVLFVVAAGNISATQFNGLDWKQRYPDYLNNDESPILDPATALNVLTVGSLAWNDQTLTSQRYSSDPAEQPIARRNQPSPFTRSGPSVGGAIKPELVAYGGNWALNTRGSINQPVTKGLGVLSTYWKHAEGNLVAEDSGTSFAAPQIAYLAGVILTEYPDAKVNLLRALLVAHATVPDECVKLFKNKKETLHKVCGYGQINTSNLNALRYSLQNQVTLLTEASIENKKHHFYELPIPESFTSGGDRIREITITLSYTPAVRSTRINYKASRIDFKLVAASDIEYVVKMFNKKTESSDYKNIKELQKSSIGSTYRSKGSVQADTWQFKQIRDDSKLRKQRLFVVITRNDFPWAEPLSDTEEPYALVVCLRDKQNQQPQLYTQLKERLQQKTRARINS